MSDHDPTVRLRHMLDYAREGIGFAQGKYRQDLDSDRKLAYALTHVIEIIGEAATSASSTACLRRCASGAASSTSVSRRRAAWRRRSPREQSRSARSKCPCTHSKRRERIGTRDR